VVDGRQVLLGSTMRSLGGEFGLQCLSGLDDLGDLLRVLSEGGPSRSGGPGRSCAGRFGSSAADILLPLPRLTEGGDPDGPGRPVVHPLSRRVKRRPNGQQRRKDRGDEL
jgi:hypothetical protein